MDLDDGKRDDEHQQPQEKETATGSGGLFGDLSHEKPSGESLTGMPQTIQDSALQTPSPLGQPAFSDPTTEHSKLDNATALQQEQRQPHDPFQQPAIAEASTAPEHHSQREAPSTELPNTAKDFSSEQPAPLRSNPPASAHQPMAYASSSHYAQQPIQSQSQEQDENAVDPSQLPPTMGAQLAEEQDLVPDELDETDSAIGSDTQSTTTTLSTSVFDYRTEHGRTYHAYKDGKYIFPNDEREADRLDLQHHLFRITFANQLFFAPLNKPRNCLDVGTGTGIWAIEFADDFPECQVVGIDLSPGQPTLVPPNLKFVIDDAEDMWIYPDKFDFIHARLMAGCFADWPNFFRQAYENLEPGGWLELQDYGLPIKSADGTADNTDLLRWGELLCEAARKLGRPMGSDCADLYLKWMEDAGFVDIQQRMFMWPSNGWPKDPFMKELGRWNQMNILDGLEGFCLALLTRGLGWRKEEVDVFVARVSRDFRDRKIHAYFPMPVVFARKPLPGEVAFKG